MEELRNEVMEQEEVREEPYKSGSIRYIDSREVAAMVGKEHSNLLKDIRRYIAQMGKVKIDFTPFFQESSYADSQGKGRACYLVTEKGCEFIAHKLTSEKGTAFSAAYINRFHEMKGMLEGQDFPAMREFMKQQTAAVNAVVGLVGQMMDGLKGLSAEVENLKSQRSNIYAGSPFSVQQDVLDQRMRTLNGLIDQVADLCGMERTKVLHYLYKTLQESLGVTLNPYLAVMKSEGRAGDICNLHVIASVDRFYEKAVDMSRGVVERKNLFD